MKRTTFVLACVMALCFVCNSGVARAQDQWSVIQALQTQLKADRQMVVAANLPLTDGESKIFWPVYKEYRTEVEQIGDRVAKLVVAYAANFSTMNDTKAEAFFKEQMEIDRARLALREKWVPRVRKVLPTLKAARFFQIENKIDAIVNLTLASEIPLVPVKK
jgi:Na+-transporting NADH:ubiquinone oxidoreductase subunit NqrC